MRNETHTSGPSMRLLLEPGEPPIFLKAQTVFLLYEIVHKVILLRPKTRCVELSVWLDDRKGEYFSM